MIFRLLRAHHHAQQESEQRPKSKRDVQPVYGPTTRLFLKGPSIRRTKPTGCNPKAKFASAQPNRESRPLPLSHTSKSASEVQRPECRVPSSGRPAACRRGAIPTGRPKCFPCRNRGQASDHDSGGPAPRARLSAASRSRLVELSFIDNGNFLEAAKALSNGIDPKMSGMHMPLVQNQGIVNDLVQLGPVLYECAANAIEGSFEKANVSLSEINRLASIVDGPLQRLSLIIADSLARRLLLSIQGFAGALIHPAVYFEHSSIQTARFNFVNLSPYLSAGFATMNQAILEALQGEKVTVVHIIDLSCSASHPLQWLRLLQEFFRRRGGPPQVVRLTVVHDNNDFLANMKALLDKEAEMLKIPFQFNSVTARLETLNFSNLRNTLGIKYGEAVAISCSLQMHRLLVVDDNVSCAGIGQLQKMANAAQLKQMASSVYSPASTLNYPQTPSPQCQIPKMLANFLNAVRVLKPNIMLVMEQDANNNALLFRDRFVEALHYYAALFDSLNAMAAANPRRSNERARVERMILGEEIRNILLCEGVHRHERHERLRQWAMYMERSGFHHVPLSFEAIKEGEQKLLSFGLNGCQFKAETGCLELCWGSRHLYFVSAWRPDEGSTSGSREHMSDMVSSATSSPASTLYSPSLHGQGSWVQELSHDQQGVRLIGLLYQCAAEVAAGALDRTNFYLEQITPLVSLDAPHTLQRLAAVFADALAQKLLSLMPGVSRALLSTDSSAEAHLIPAARRHLFDVLPFMKLAYLTANHAILEAMEGERFVHVVDLSGPAANLVQWVALFHAFRARPGGPPHLRITAVHDSREFLDNMAAVLATEAEAFDIPFQFSAVEARLDDLDPDALRHSLRVRSGEALAISVVGQLHRLLAADDGAAGGRRHVPGSSCLTPLQIIARSSPSSFGELLEREVNTRLQLSPDASSVLSSLSPQSPVLLAAAAAAATQQQQQQRPAAVAKLGSFLQTVRALSPKIMVVAEPEANHNAATFQERFDEALNYYASLFDCLERASAAHRCAAETRARAERLVLGEDIRGVVAREGAERKERHERLAQWARRMEGAGMEQVKLTFSGMMEARKLLQTCGWSGYDVVHDARRAAFFFCWHLKPLYSVSAWRPAACRHAGARLDS
ncbi:hypothetical protein U9M48_005327 [Paspalum notatum var. saurae]|uniref:Scarecrow-like protein 3 n=1 Tax=Paspalum notatum var. saurae TaxID=547442 RepID=A0AAQ3PWP1_PASNO